MLLVVLSRVKRLLSSSCQASLWGGRGLLGSSHAKLADESSDLGYKLVHTGEPQEEGVLSEQIQGLPGTPEQWCQVLSESPVLRHSIIQ